MSNYMVMKRLLKLVRPLRVQMFFAILMGTLGHLAALSIPVLGAYFLLLIYGKSVYFSLGLGLLFLLALLRGFLRYGEQAFNHYIAFKLLAILRDHVFEALRRLCPAKLEKKDSGNLITLITSDIELLEVFYAHTISPVLIASIFSIILLIIFASMHLLLSITACLAYLTLGVFLPIALSKYSGRESDTFRLMAGAFSSYFLDSLRGLGEIIQYEQGIKRLEAIQKQTQKLSAQDKKVKMKGATGAAISQAFIYFFNFIMLATSIYLYSNNLISFPAMVLSVVLMMSSFGPVLALSGLGTGLQNTFAAGRRVLDLLDEPILVPDIQGKEKTSFESAKLKNLSFTYEEAQAQVLNNLSADFSKGKIYGIMGESGSGKSTILKLLMRFWNPNGGEILISDQALEEINTQDLRNMEAYMTQETHLFHGSLKENLLIAKLDANQNELDEACKAASIYPFIQNLEFSYDTQVSELGESLSGGERQRIGLARAFLHQADLLLLDEPTSNLDSLNEAHILKAIKDYVSGTDRTVILVSHRPSTLKIADEIFEMKEGRLKPYSLK